MLEFWFCWNLYSWALTPVLWVTAGHTSKVPTKCHADAVDPTFSRRRPWNRAGKNVIKLSQYSTYLQMKEQNQLFWKSRSTALSLQVSSLELRRSFMLVQVIYSHELHGNSSHLCISLLIFPLSLLVWFPLFFSPPHQLCKYRENTCPLSVFVYGKHKNPTLTIRGWCGVICPPSQGGFPVLML